MSDERKVLLTPEGVYLQDEDGQGWTFLPGTEEHEYPLPTHLTNEEAEQQTHKGVNVTELSEAFEALQAAIARAACVLCDLIDDLVPLVVESIQSQYREELPRPDYKTRPRCCTLAKVKPHRKQRSRER